MTLWTRIQNAAHAMLGRINQPSYWIGRSKSSIVVTQENARQFAAVFACVRVISESLAAMPFQVYRSDGKSRIHESAHPIDWLISTQPNPEMSAFAFWEAMISYALTWGDGYAEIERNAGGIPANLWLIGADRPRLERNSSGNLVYIVRNEDGSETTIAAENMLHVRGPSSDGLTGMSTVSLARESIGTGLAMDQFAGGFFGNGLHAGGVLKHPGKLSDQAHAHLKESLKELSGTQKAHAPLILEEGITWERLGLPPGDAQFLDSRVFQVREICRWFRVPPHKLGDMGQATYNNVEQQNVSFVVDTLLPWAARIEQECNLKLFGRKQRGTYYTKFKFQALLRGDIASRYAAYAVARQWGWLSVNDVRELEEMNPVEGGEEYLMPVNMLPLRFAEKYADKLVTKAAPAPATGKANDEDMNQEHTNGSREAVNNLMRRLLTHDKE